MRQWQDRMMAYEVYEWSLLRLMKTHLAAGSHVIDIGANIGFISLHAAKLIGPSGTVNAFEPQPSTAMRLNENIKRNRLEDVVHAHQFALGSAAGELELVSYGNVTGLTSRYDRGGHLGKREKFVCQQFRLDNISSLPQPHFIKIDCEGSEAAVIEGAEGILRHPSPPVIAFEYSSEWITYGNESLGATCERILMFNDRYRFYDIEDMSVALSMEKISEISSWQFANIACVPVRNQIGS